MQYSLKCRCGRTKHFSSRISYLYAVKNSSGCKSCRTLSDITRGKISQKQLGHVVSEETRNKIAFQNSGKKRTIEQRKRLSESLIGRVSTWKDKNLPEDVKKKISASKIGRIPSDNEKKKLSETMKKVWDNPLISKKYYDALSKSKWIKVRMDIGQQELLDKWNRLGFNFEPNYTIKTDLGLYYLDGYDKSQNVVLEFDSKYHKRKNQQRVDSIRQKNIIEFLNPKVFWRYDSTYKICKDVYRSNHNLNKTKVSVDT